MGSGWQLYAAQKQAFTPKILAQKQPFTPKILAAYEYAMLNDVDWLIYRAPAWAKECFKICEVWGSREPNQAHPRTAAPS
jgi:hypothetical protein